MKKPVSKFAFQVHNLRRYTAARIAAQIEMAHADFSAKEALDFVSEGGLDAVGLCTLNQVDP